MRKKAERAQLTARERAFCNLVADYTDRRSLGMKGQSVGWRDRKHAYRVARRPLVAQEIERRVNDGLRMQRARALSVLNDLADRALEGDNVAARLYLEGVGLINRGGVSVVTAVTANAGAETSADESLEARIARLAARQ